VILDHLTNAHLYRLGERFDRGFEFLRAKNLPEIPDGKYPIAGEDLFAIVQTYTTKPAAEGRWESHRRYADIQYLIRGRERIGVRVLHPPTPAPDMQIETAYDDEKDIIFYTGTGDCLTLDAGHFTVFFPQDIHMPSLALEDPAEVKKAVIKVRLD
jgi:YhcH/YjgK/YiaL family protein